jgi:beta-glucosidase
MQIKNFLIAIILIFLNTSHVILYAQQPKYKNQLFSIHERVTDLISRMTLEEKVAQLISIHPGRPKLDDVFFNNSAKMDSMFKNGVGMVNPIFDMKVEETVKMRNRLQEYMKNKTRLGIPTIFIDEAHHGLMNLGSNVFPQTIGLACSWDPVFVELLYNFIASEANARGTNLVLSPVVDVCRDPRWGRTGETLGEDPYLCGIMGSAMVRGFQGSRDGTITPGHVASTLKHFAAHGQPEGGLNQSPANYSVRMLREIHMEPFRLCIQNAKPACIMASYNEIDGVPSHANKWLLTDVLRNEWHFNGVVVSDWFGIDQLWKKHYVADTEKNAALIAFNAGVTIDLPYGVNYRHLVELVNDKKISVAEIDEAVSKILTLKFMLGLFESAPIDLEKARRTTADIRSRKLALQAAEESMVLLKNENSLLPIKKNQFKKIAVIGPCAATNYLGDYSGVPNKNVSLLEGIKNKVGDQCEVLYSKGCMLTKNGDTISLNNLQFINKVEFPTHEENLELIKQALEVACQSDFIIIAIGENEQLCREAWIPDHFGDNYTLDMQSDQEELVKAVVALKKPVLVYLMHARPLAINWIAENVPAIIDGWYMGEEAGNAFANILFGETCPSGKLTITWPRSAGQIPMYYNHKPSAQYFDYVSGKPLPLFPFGYGLSYTTFEYSNLRLSNNSMKSNGFVNVEVDIKNTGKMKGDEIVQLYIHDKVSSVTRPVKELKDFLRISLAPGETKTVSFKIDASKLAFWTKDMKFEAEPGSFEFMVGRSSIDYQKLDFNLLE